MNATQHLYCATHLIKMAQFYSANIHGYISLLICIIGTVGNFINLVVFSNKNFIISPVNMILRALAAVDLVVLVDFIPYTWYSFLRPARTPHRDKFTYEWAVFMLCHAYLSLVFNTIAIWLTVVLAIWRYIAVAHLFQNKFWCNETSTRRTVMAGFVVCPILCGPLLYSSNIIAVPTLLDTFGFVSQNASASTNYTLYVLRITSYDGFLLQLNFLIYCVLIKLIPSVALTAFSIKFVCVLIQSKRNCKNLTLQAVERGKQIDRISRMLLAVLFLFLLTEIPQGVFGLLAHIHGEKFFAGCYDKLGDIADLLALMNSSLNFFLYYTMSSQYRAAVKSLFHHTKTASCISQFPMTDCMA